MKCIRQSLPLLFLFCFIESQSMADWKDDLLAGYHEDPSLEVESPPRIKYKSEDGNSFVWTNDPHTKIAEETLKKAPTEHLSQALALHFKYFVNEKQQSASGTGAQRGFTHGYWMVQKNGDEYASMGSLIVRKEPGKEEGLLSFDLPKEKDSRPSMEVLSQTAVLAMNYHSGFAQRLSDFKLTIPKDLQSEMQSTIQGILNGDAASFGITSFKVIAPSVSFQ
ncbi:MAG: hypothetical protein HOI80_05875 [Alphaproteobacteria bacterium]|mgnify:FL=1|jgi:hypothetical protein|nr:hypothetical protein [Alphaproteobacteria bacterium]MBT5389926.1 hypothetical protein [Alphaproteobacteria bacterium]MBT5540029.1 hypothetical protein [Alphaproteobacteria bacterium]MBT5655004.1 hypothetical protein [Alphaproteobacteria bacterium]